MGKYYAAYEQGAKVTRDDFDPVKVIPYMFEWYHIKLPEGILSEIQNNNLTANHFEYICKKLELNPTEKSLQGLCNAALKPYVLHDWFADDEEVCFGSEMVSGELYEKAQGYFHPDDPDALTERIDGDVIFISFNVPIAWNIADAIVPANKKIAVFQLQEGTKKFMKDDIDWIKRLGCLSIALKSN